MASSLSIDNLSEIKALKQIQTLHEKRIDKLEQAGVRLMIGVTLLAGGGGAIGAAIAKAMGV